MLLYDFGSKESPVSAIMDEVRSRQATLVEEVQDGRSSSRNAVQVLWDWLVHPEPSGCVRLYAQMRLSEAVSSSRPAAVDATFEHFLDIIGEN